MKSFESARRSEYPACIQSCGECTWCASGALRNGYGAQLRREHRGSIEYNMRAVHEFVIEYKLDLL